MTRQRLNRVFVLVWGLGIIGLFATSGLFFFIYRDYDLPERLLLSLSPSNTWFHPTFYEPAREDLFALIAASSAAELIAADHPVHLVLNATVPSRAEQEESDRLKIAHYWLYPHRVHQVCTLADIAALASDCQPMAAGIVLIGWGFDGLPGYTCVTNARRYFVCH